MAKSSSLEHDFFAMDKGSTALPPPTAAPVFQRRRSFRDIQGVITKMNPEVVKSVIGNGAFASPSPKLSLRCGGDDNRAPMTIFYNGMVSVFDVSPRKAQDILKVADQMLPSKSPQNLDSNSNGETNLLESFNGDLPISRKNSLQRFLQKRKERVEH
ncbi:protein TIFY 9-like isoform X2 [Salvia hispanica]|uniref:protein TIFY 9-like isoform X2 n=1 Tax=Salvia hispanica TaxID=49212 RepID=UPI002009D785|nr:protein TIFY 9-like isoform X2 [Salvia hispanica]XP_047959344.1 protein TIFY 9-like isoform X2 [Salvia hispanica]